MVRMAASEVCSAEVLFAAIDLDESGFVTIEELLLLSGQLTDAADKESFGSSAWTPKRIAEVAGAKAKSKQLTQGEFAQLYKSVQPWMVEASQLTALVEASKRGKLKVGPVSNDLELVAKTFNAIDLNGDGKIDVDELMIFGKKIGVAKWDRAVCNALLGRVDTDQNGTIELHEFEAFVELIGLEGSYGQVERFVKAAAAKAMAEAFPEEMEEMRREYAETMKLMRQASGASLLATEVAKAAHAAQQQKSLSSSRPPPLQTPLTPSQEKLKSEVSDSLNGRMSNYHNAIVTSVASESKDSSNPMLFAGLRLLQASIKSPSSPPLAAVPHSPSAEPSPTELKDEKLARALRELAELREALDAAEKKEAMQAVRIIGIASDEMKWRAATVIQASFQGFLAREYVRGLIDASTQREEAASKIQGGFAGMYARRQIKAASLEDSPSNVEVPIGTIVFSPQLWGPRARRSWIDDVDTHVNRV